MDIMEAGFKQSTGLPFSGEVRQRANDLRTSNAFQSPISREHGFLLAANSFQPPDGVPAGATVRFGTTVHVALWVVEVVDFKPVKTSRHGMAPWTATIREKGEGKRLTRLRGSSLRPSEAPLGAP